MTLAFRSAVLAVLAMAATPALAQAPTAAAPAAATAPMTPVAAPPPAPVAAPAPAPDAAAPAAAPAAPTGPIGAPPAGKGQVVFFRPSAFVGWAVWYRVRENEVEINKLSNGLYFVATVDPGTHTFTAATENKNKLTMEVDAGETYYVRGSVTMGLVVGEANIAPSDQGTFIAAYNSKKLKLAPPVVVKAADAAPATK